MKKVLPYSIISWIGLNIKPGRGFFIRIVSLLIASLVWQGSSYLGINNSLFPPPTRVFHALVSMFIHDHYVIDILASSQRLIVGYCAGATIGVLFGLLTGRFELMNNIFGPIIQALRPISPISLVPIAILWFGLGDISKYFLVFWGVFFPVWINTNIGVKNIDQHYVWAAQSLGARQLTLLLTVILPAAMTMILAGLRTAIPIAFYTIVAAELAGAYSGVAYQMNVSALDMRFGQMFAGLVVLGIMSTIADKVFVLFTRAIFPWSHQ